MSKTLSQNFEESQGFDCSAYIGHGLQWPMNECPNDLEGFITRTVDLGACECHARYTKKESVTDRDWGALLQEEMNAVSQKEKNVLEEQYYESEYNTLLKWMDEGDIIVPPPSQFADKRDEIQRISLLADEALGRDFYNTNAHRQARSSNSEDLANEVAIKAIETPRRVMSPGGFQNFVEEQLIGYGEEQTEKFGKRRLCRHFVNGYCLRGDSCDFIHDPSIFCSDNQKVFLGGLPLHLTPAILKTELEKQGLTVLNKPRIMRGFTPQVCLGSVEEAEKLIAQRYIIIGNQRVDVRLYQDKDQLRQVFPSVVKRSVFLGGLPENTTGEMIVADLQRLDIKVEDVPTVKNGYAPRVVLGCLEHAKMLVALKRVMVNGAVVDVRPYVYMRNRY